MRVDAEHAPSRFERWRRATLAPFEHRAFALFRWATLVSSYGSMIQTVGASWLMATIAPSAEMVALVQTASALPFFILSLRAGAFADTRDGRSIMLVSQVVALLASVARGRAFKPPPLPGAVGIPEPGVGPHRPIVGPGPASPGHGGGCEAPPLSPVSR